MIKAADDCRWHEADDPGPRRRILEFLSDIGIDVVVRAVSDDSVLPGMTVSCGRILLDPDITHWPGDLLHEAGHIAMIDPAVRDTATGVSDDPGEEMGAIAWSYAAAVHLGIAPEILFHPEGYRGGADAFVSNFTAGRFLGVPMLALYGLSAEPCRAAGQGIAPYPAMQRWLR